MSHPTAVLFLASATLCQGSMPQPLQARATLCRARLLLRWVEKVTLPRDLVALSSQVYNNQASGDFSSVSGGFSNKAAGAASSRYATGTASSVSGGKSNTASGLRSTVSGGYSNVASGGTSSILGDKNRNCNNDYCYGAVSMMGKSHGEGDIVIVG